ncbi:hypothetical protein LCGC14_0477910 [marine sediment metagenome]|uniref:Uncharacterized protein n=1 Tax=marine sediment metagenome TaxID=412755 RepID=A0A0F9SAE2_9ZZZZ
MKSKYDWWETLSFIFGMAMILVGVYEDSLLFFGVGTILLIYIISLGLSELSDKIDKIEKRKK